MNFLGMGPMEVLVILVVALIIFGPGKLPEIGAQAGKMMRDFRNATADLTAEFQDSIDDMQATMGEMKATVTDFQNETQQLAEMVPNSLNVGDVMKPFPDRPTGMPGANGAADTAAATATASPPIQSPAAAPQVTAATLQTNGSGEAHKVPSKKDPLADFGG